MDWQGAPPSPSSHVVKKILRLEVPVDSYPNVCPPSACAVSLEVHTKESLNFKIFVDYFSLLSQFNFVGRILGPRGNSLKRVEASTGCRVFIRGKGSIKDPGKVREVLSSYLH